MSWDSVTSIAQIIGTIAVILSLVYVGKELAQNNRNQRIAAYQAHNEAFRENISLITTHPDTWARGLQNYPNLSDSDNIIFGMSIHSSFRHIEQAYILNRENVLSDDAYRKSLSLIANLCAYQGCRYWWDSRKEYFEKGLIEDVDAYLRSDKFKPLYEYKLGS
jgi:hypothetical protein